MDSRSKSNNAQRAAAPFDKHDFDFGLGPSFATSSASGSLNAQRHQFATDLNQHGAAGSAGGAPWAAQNPSAPSSSPAWTSFSSSKPTPPSSSSSSFADAWSLHSSPASGGLHAPARSMAGDITGKSWGAMDNVRKSSADKSGFMGGLNTGASSDLFGDLLGSSRSFASPGVSKPDCLGSSRSFASPRVRKPQQQASRGYMASAFSNLNSMATSLPKGTAMKDMKSSNAYQTEEMGDFVSADGAQNAKKEDAGWAAFEGLSSSTSFSGFSGPAKVTQNYSSQPSTEDPFGDFGSFPPAKASASMSASANTFSGLAKVTQNYSSQPSTEDPFGNFGSFPPAKASASMSASANTVSHMSKASSPSSDDFFNFASAAHSNVTAPKFSDPPRVSNNIGVDPFAFLGGSKISASQSINSNSAGSDPFETFVGKATSQQQKQTDPFETFVGKATSQKKQTDPVLDSLWGSTKSQPGLTAQNISDDWGVDTSFVAGDHTDATTELDGLPPPPPGVSATLSKEKGLEYYKQGQFADAIKWLSWAETLLHQNGDSIQIVEVLTRRSSCLKEAGEYKKAVADCTKVVELDNGNTSILLQRALLYESMEKYKLGIADLKEVLKKEPQNRVAMSTLARLKKMQD